MRAFWILVPVMMLALTIPATTSACPGCGKDKSAEGAPVFGAEQGGCPHAQKAVEAGECPCAKAAAAKAEGAKVSVLDVGAGSGLLAMMAARWATEVSVETTMSTDLMAAAVAHQSSVSLSDRSVTSSCACALAMSAAAAPTCRE